MGRRSNSVLQKIPNIRKKFIAVSGVTLIALSAIAPFATADVYDEKINKLKRENAQTQSQRDDLRNDARTLEEKIASLRTEIASIEGQIRENQAKDQQLKQEIAKHEAELAKERVVLGKSVKEMYVENDMSTLEMLASSKNLSEFLDREQYRTSVQNEISEVMSRIEAIKDKLDKQKVAVEKLLKDQKSMRDSLATKRNENNRLLALNQSQQAEYNRNISSNNTRIAELQRQQAIENARYNVGTVSYSGSGSYPWANVPYPSSDPDPWGMYKRECVSYTAWKVSNSGRHMPYWGGRGNAKLWDDNARAAGIPVDYNPRVGDVAISNSGTYGHAMYVEKVHGDGTITVSQYNASWDGRYSEVRRSAANLSFIHFQ